MGFPKRETVEEIRKEYPAGCEVVLDRMDACHRIDTDETVKAFLDDYGKTQAGGNCPRCGSPMPHLERHAVSRRAGIIVCDSCGTEEALEDAGMAAKKPLFTWRHGRREGNEPQKNACLRRAGAWRQIHTGRL